MIPEAAVEAAAIEWVGEYVWQDCNHAWRADYLERTRAMLEAAATHMLASVADEREGDLFRFTLAQREWLRGGAA